MELSEFQILMVKILQNVKIKILCMLNLHGVLFCTGIHLDDIMQIDCLAYKYFVFYRYHWLVTTLGIV